MSDGAPFTHHDIDAILRFYRDAGVDEPLAAEPVDRFGLIPAQNKQATRPAPSAPKPPPAPTTVAPVAKAVVPDETVFAEAHQRAASATNLDGLRAALEAFDGCNLKHTARNLAFEGGMRTADIMLVGGAASRDDDETGVPFSGLDGILLRNMFAAIGIDAATQTYQAMCVPWAPPGGGPPTPLHLKLCAPFIARQIALARPKCLVLLGNVAARHMLSETKRTILQLRGQWLAQDFGNGETTILVMHDPDFLRRQPSAKRQTWFDLLALQKRLTSA